MQLISEAYHLLKSLLGFDNEKIAATFDEWNKGDLDSYLIEITRDIFRKKDEESKDKYVVDLILDSAGQKGTGKWTVNAALEFGMPLTTIGEAVFARCLSAQKDERVSASKILPGPKPGLLHGLSEEDKQKHVDSIRDAVLAAKIVSYTQGYVLMRAAAKEYGWKLNYGGVALMWRGGCIIRSKFLGKIKDAFDNKPELENLLFDKYFQELIGGAQEGWRRTVISATTNGVPAPGITSSLSYYDGLRAEVLPANLIQAQRDYFGAHTYQRLDKPRDQSFHTNWTGHGGSTSASTYTV